VGGGVGGSPSLLRKILVGTFFEFENFGGLIFSKFGELARPFSSILETYVRNFFLTLEKIQV